MSLHITLRQLEIFCTIVKTGSAVNAGEYIGLSQSAISSALKEIENQLGEPLFDRAGKRLVSNAQGKQFYSKAVSLLEQAQELQQFFDGEKGTIHVAASTTVGNYLLPPILAEFKKVYPDIIVRLTVANSNEVTEQVAQFECDVGLIEGICHHAELNQQIWQYDELVWFCANPSQWITSLEQAIPLHQLLTKPLIVRERGSGTQQLVENALLQYDLTLNPRQNPALDLMELGNSEAIKQAVRYDLGIGCLSRHTIAELLQWGELQEIKTQEPNILRPLLLIQQTYKSNRRLVNIFNRFIGINNVVIDR